MTLRAWTTSGARPSLWQEAWSGLDWFALRFSPVYYGLGIAHGRGQPVVLVPGFLATDLHMVELYAWLARIGYRPYFSGLAGAIECSARPLGLLAGTVRRAARDSGRPVRLIGHSLGGLLARTVAAAHPELVEMVITLGTPCSGVPGDESRLRSYSVYSKLDGVLDWRTCVQDDPGSNHEVASTHSGMPFHPEVYRAIARRLAEAG